MTVLQIIKDLAGEQDINWGDSDTTFARQTHTGGSTNINYIDSKSIPSNALGGVIDDYIHTQNTDTGTTETNFYIRSGSNPAILSTTGLTGTRLFSFPDLTGQLAGVGELSQTTAGYGASMSGVQDAAGYFTGNDVEAVLAELAADVAGVVAYAGYKRGFVLGYSNTTTITISGGMWDHKGTSRQAVYTTSQLSFVCGSGGSNGASDNLDASNIHYIYIDDSAVVSAGTTLLTASEFLNDKTVPAYSHAANGWYNGNDRCIGCVLTNGASQITAFHVYSNDLYAFTTAFPEEYADAAAPVAPTELDLASSVPIYSTRAKLKIKGTTDVQEFAFGPGAALLDIDYFVAPTDNDAFYSIEVLLDTGQSTWLTCSAAGNITIDVVGYYQNEL